MWSYCRHNHVVPNNSWLRTNPWTQQLRLLTEEDKMRINERVGTICMCILYSILSLLFPTHLECGPSEKTSWWTDGGKLSQDHLIKFLLYLSLFISCSFLTRDLACCRWLVSTSLCRRSMWTSSCATISNFWSWPKNLGYEKIVINNNPIRSNN